ncbi:anion transporter 6 [Populus alba x Populus x berolinensis]|uniref:Anion transporter 6 n=1 Tax=Populus alba x Populus x berolinensis TaxID=444605 RepID=A0AAD6QLC0_9ROSI|nr:anion transporter 6 [Populus alba x Populus x berolinensis]
MANLSFKAENFSFLSHHTNTQTSLLNTTNSFKANSLRLFHSKNSLTFRVWCGIKEKENVTESERVPDVLTGLKRVDELDPKRVSSLDFEQKLGNDSGSSEVGFDWNWPPWKNIPQRYKLIGTTSLAFVICNMDKVNLSVAIIPMSHQFGWNSSTAGLVQSSFFWGYALSQLPGGWLAKIFGGRKVLKFGVLTWSVATALLPFLAGYMPGLMLSRVLVGIGEGVSPSAATDLIARHIAFFYIIESIPLEERSRAVAFVFGGLSVGSVIGLLLAPPLIQNFGWASVFYIFGFLGLAWFLGFQYLEEGQASHATKPASRPQSIHMEKSFSNSLAALGGSLKDVPWKAFFRTPSVWAMIYAHFCGSWGHYNCLSWLPSYFSEELSLNLTEAAWVSILPPLASVFVTSFAAQLADNLIANGVETTTVRKICQTIAFLSPALCMTLSSVDLGLPPWEIVGILTGGLALSSFALSGLYCTHQDMSPEYASILLGITNTVGAIPGIVGVALTGYLLDTTHSWSISLFAPSIFFYLTGTIVWLAFASSKPQNFSNTD